MTDDMSADSAFCPLCGEQNLCEMTAGGKAEDCWCMNVKVSEALLNQRPLNAKGLPVQNSCICRKCIAASELPKHKS